jgi:beta-aspartyl-peptidase (threonine type)
MSDRPASWSIIVHGGARTIPPDEQPRHLAGVRAATSLGREQLLAGASALDAVEAAVRALEDDPTFNAGCGAVLNGDGQVELDASIMDGERLLIGGVGAVSGLRHPISVARRMLPETPVLLVGEGAQSFAAEQRAERALCLGPPETTRERGSSADTVGCVALDGSGHIAVGLSTGGLTGKHPGRLGDCPLPGCGFYADDEVGGVAFSGDGESIARTLLAARAMQWLGKAGPQAALARALKLLDRVGGEAGGISLDASGRFGCAHTSDHFAVALASDRVSLTAAIDQRQLEGLADG